MRTDLYISRKYKRDGELILKDFTINMIDDYVKKRNYHIGRLKVKVGSYPIDTICLYKSLKNFDSINQFGIFDGSKWDGTWDKHVLVKCFKNETSSGYESIRTYNFIIEKCK